MAIDDDTRADSVEALFDAYAAGFDDFDSEAIAGCFAYPCTIWQLGRGNVFHDRDELLENIEALLDVFEGEEIVHSSVEIDACHEAGETALVSARWRQEREDGEAALAFGCRYALIREADGWRIALVVNEDPAA